MGLTSCPIDLKLVRLTFKKLIRANNYGIFIVGYIEQFNRLEILNYNLFFLLF